MSKPGMNYLTAVLVAFTILFAFTGGDCTTESEPKLVALPLPPASIILSLSALPGLNSYATVNWSASLDESREDFYGYRVFTYTVDSAGTNITLIDDTSMVKGNRTHNILSIQRGITYKTYVASLLKDDTEGKTVATKIYGGVFYNNNGSIDEFQESGPAQSGYGWDPVTGNGVQYPYTTENLPLIDLHMTRESNQLVFVSPSVYSDSTGKLTYIDSIGAGADAFANTNLQDPLKTSVPVSDETVYLLKVSSNNYIKIWVKTVEQIGDPAYSRVTFEYKVQPITGMRILKR